MNVEFVLIVDTRRRGDVSVDELRAAIDEYEQQVLVSHPESGKANGRFLGELSDAIKRIVVR